MKATIPNINSSPQVQAHSVLVLSIQLAGIKARHWEGARTQTWLLSLQAL